MLCQRKVPLVSVIINQQQLIAYTLPIIIIILWHLQQPVYKQMQLVSTEKAYSSMLTNRLVRNN